MTLFVALFLSFAILSPAHAQDLSSKLVSTEWLEANLTKENIRLIDMRSDINDYWQAHLPGAVYLDTGSLRWPDRGVPGKLMPPEALVILLGNLGISEHTSVIVYSAKNDYRATYFIWALDYLGHKSSAILENGIERWKAEGRPLTQDYPVIKPTQYPLPSRLRHEVRATLEEVKEATKGGAVILDVRPADLYSGEKGNWKRKGHIKGAINYYWSLTLNEDGTWKSKDQLKKEYEAIGVTPDKTIIVS